LPWLEAAIGLLVLFGAFTRAALIAGALLIALLTFGSSLHQDWDVVGLQLIYALVYFVLISLRKYNTFSVDGLLLRERG
jgi:thiosulfate dehydrogenase [quinone] large subunit